MTASDAAAAWQSVAISLAAAVVGFAALAMRKPQEEVRGAPARPPTAALARLGLERVLVLRLAAASNRSLGLVQEARELGLPLEFLDATDGLRNETFLSRTLPLSLPESTCADLIGAIFDSHERAWMIAGAGSRPALVLEDDARLPPDFVEVLGRRMRDLPQGYHMAFAGTSVTPNAQRISASLSRPDEEDVNKQALLGFWAYVVTPKGAQRLLNLAKRARRFDRRSFQPVDLFVAHRLKQIDVYVFEPTPDLARKFELSPDRHHVLETMRQVGIVTLAQSPSLNRPAQDEESTGMLRLLDKAVGLGNQMKYMRSWRVAWKALSKMRRYSCWSAGPLLQNAGLSLLNILQTSAAGPAVFGGPNQTLQAAMEAFASSARYTEGTWMERRKLAEFPSWTRHALSLRASRGLPAIAPPEGWDERVPLPCGGWLDPRTPALAESQSRCPSAAAAAAAAAPPPAGGDDA